MKPIWCPITMALYKNKAVNVALRPVTAEQQKSFNPSKVVLISKTQGNFLNSTRKRKKE